MSNKKGPPIMYGPDLKKEIEFYKKEIEFYKKELDYYQKQLVECREIIEQLFTHKVKDYIFIHPFDVYDLMNKYTVVDIIKRDDCHGLEGNVLTIKDKKYKQTANIPARNTTLK